MQRKISQNQGSCGMLTVLINGNFYNVHLVRTVVDKSSKKYYVRLSR